MATSADRMSNATSQPLSSEATLSRSTRSAEPGPVPNGSRQPPRGRPGRPRNGGRTHKVGQDTRENKPSRGDSSSSLSLPNTSGKATLPEKPTLTITSPSGSSNNTNKKNTSARPSRVNSALTTSRSSPVAEVPASPASSRSSNRRKRSGAGKGNNIPKINQPPPSQSNPQRPGRPRVPDIPLTAPNKDPPPHLSQNLSPTPIGSFDMSKNIEALVERVRAVAMAENRPSTPGSHIDWAGDDDDSLPDLDDWGIPSINDHKAAQTMSPIVVGGLKPLPELSSAASENVGKNKIPSPSDAPSGPANETSAQRRPIARSSSPLKPPVDATTQVDPPSRREPNGDKPSPSPDITQDQEDAADLDAINSGGLDQSIHAPSAEQHPEPERKGLGASIHAPRAMVDSQPSPTHFDARSPRNRQTHARAHTVGRPYPRPNQNDNDYNRSPRSGRGGFLGSPKRHARNYSSPSTTTTNRPPHSRPVLTGDAMSRLARAVGSTTPKTTPVAND